MKVIQVVLLFGLLGIGTFAFGEAKMVPKKGLEKGVVVEMIEEMSLSGEDPTPRVYRIHDKTNKVVCFAIEGRTISGFSCTPCGH